MLLNHYITPGSTPHADDPPGRVALPERWRVQVPWVTNPPTPVAMVSIPLDSEKLHWSNML